MQELPNPNQQYPQFQQPQQQPNYTQPQSYYPSQQEWQRSVPLPPQPDYTQPPTYYPPQKRPLLPPTKSRRLDRILWILVGVAIGLVFGLVLGSSYGKPTTTTSSNTGTQDTAQVTSQSQPTQTTTQEAPTPIPTIAPISLSGLGQQASHKFQLHQGLTIFQLTHNGTSNFIVHLLDGNGHDIDYLVNEIGSFNGSK